MEFVKPEMPEPTRKELLQRRMYEIVMGAFEIGYELGKADDKKPNK